VHESALCYILSNSAMRIGGFYLDLNWTTDVDWRTEAGRLFHYLGPESQKARLPNLRFLRIIRLHVFSCMTVCMHVICMQNVCMHACMFHVHIRMYLHMKYACDKYACVEACMHLCMLCVFPHASIAWLWVSPTPSRSLEEALYKFSEWMNDLLFAFQFTLVQNATGSRTAISWPSTKPVMHKPRCRTWYYILCIEAYINVMCNCIGL